MRQLGQREATRTLEGHVANRGGMEAAIEDLGTRAQAAGLTTAQVKLHLSRASWLLVSDAHRASLTRLSGCGLDVSVSSCVVQVMGKVAAERSIPEHDPNATTAEDAYKISVLATGADLRHMQVSPLHKALTSPAELATLQGTALWKSLDPFVRYMLAVKQKDGLLQHERDECSQWLALYQVCRKMLLMRSGAMLDEGVAPLEGTGEEGACSGIPCAGPSPSPLRPAAQGAAVCCSKVARPCVGVVDEEELDLFAAKQARVLHLQPFADKAGFLSPAAVVHFAQRFGSLETHEEGMQYKISDRQLQLVKTTLAVCAVRCNKNRITTEMGRALIKTLKPSSPKDVCFHVNLSDQITVTAF